MDDKVKGLEILSNTILKSIRHKDYKRVTQIAEEYYDIFTGFNIPKYLRQIVSREDDALFEQRCKIFQSTIPATVSNLEDMFNKPLRSNRIYSSIEHPNSTAYNEIIDRIARFYQGEAASGLDAYLAERWKGLNVYDPNAFIAVEFSDFNPVTEKTTPFPVEYSSSEAINYEYKNGILNWLIVQLAINYRTSLDKPDSVSAGYRYIMYLENWAIVLTQVDTKTRITDVPNPVFYEVKDSKGKVDSVYVLQEYNTKAKRVPAFRAGYRKDAITNKRTCKSILHEALVFFKKELKNGSEFDLLMSMHAFPMRVQYGKPCEGDKKNNIQCIDGHTAAGTKCNICKGKGQIAISTSTQHITWVKPPKNAGDPTLDVTKAFAYITPPVDFVKFQEEYLDRLTEKAKGAIFLVDSIQRKTADKTATEMDYSYDNLNDTYQPFGQKYSFAWTFIVRQIAIYTDNDTEQLTIYHRFPKDPKLKSLGQLLEEAKLASESGLSQHAINAINNDVLEAQYADDQDTLTKIKVRDRFHPFSGKSKEELQSIMMSGDIIPYYKTLYLYFDVIFQEIDNELGDKFYLMTYENQKGEVKKRVDAIISQVDEMQAKKLETFRNQMGIGQPAVVKEEEDIETDTE